MALPVLSHEASRNVFHIYIYFFLTLNVLIHGLVGAMFYEGHEGPTEFDALLCGLFDRI